MTTMINLGEAIASLNKKCHKMKLTDGAAVWSMADLWYSIIIIFIACLFNSSNLALQCEHGVADIWYPSAEVCPCLDGGIKVAI